MALASTNAEGVLRARFSNPINPVPSGPRAGQGNLKVLGFDLPDGRVLALNLEVKYKTHIWFQPPEPAELDGMAMRPKSRKSANLNGRLAVLSNRKELRVGVTSVVLDRGGAVHGIPNPHAKLYLVGATWERLNPQEATRGDIERQSAEAGSHEYGASMHAPECLVSWQGCRTGWRLFIAGSIIVMVDSAGDPIDARIRMQPLPKPSGKNLGRPNRRTCF